MTGPIFNAGAIEATAKIDRTQFVADLKSMQADIAAFQRNPINIGVKIDRNSIKADLTALKAELSGTSAVKIDIGANTAQAKRDVATFRAYVKGLSSIDLSIGANVAQAKRDIAAYRADIRALASTNISVGANTAQARRDIAALKALTGNITVNVNANTLAALLRLQQVNSQTNQLNGKTATVNVRTGRDTGTSNTLIAAIGAGITGLIYLAPAAAAGIAGVVGAAATGAQTFGALTLGLNGVKNAYQAMATQAQQGAVQENVAHSGVESALRSLDNTRAAALRSAENSAQSTTDAERTAARQQITSIQSIGDAKRSQARTIESSDQAVEDAERNLSRAQSSATDASDNLRESVNNLNEARQQELFTLDDLALKLRNASLSEEEAQAALDRAILHQRILQRDPLATSLDFKDAHLAIERAQLTLDQSKQSYKEVQTESDKAAQVGVEGSDAVVAAQKQVTQATKQVAQANQQVEDSQRSLDRTREQSFQAQEDAARSLNRAIDDAKYAQESANESVTKSIEAARDTQIQSAQSIQDALARVSDAQESAGNIGVKQLNRVQYAMSLLSPEGQKFVHFLYDEARPAINSISDAVATNMLPRLTTAGRTLLTLVPEIRTGLGETGTTIGDLAIQGSKLATSGPFRADFATIMHGNNLMLSGFGQAALLGVDASRSLYVESLPILQVFTNWALKSTQLFDTWVQGKRQSGELAAGMHLAGEKAKELWDLFVSLIKTSYDLGVALSPVGHTILDIVNGLLSFVQWLNNVNPAILTFIGYATLVATVLSRVNRGLIQLFAYPATATAGFAKLSESISSAALNAGVYTEKVTGSAAAGEKVASAGDKIATGVGKMAIALPIIGLAIAAVTVTWDHFVTSTDEATTALLKGGRAADDATKALQGQSAISSTMSGIASVLSGSIVGVTDGNDGLSRSLRGMAPTLDDATKAMQDQRAAMDPLTRAQSDAARAQQDYLFAIDKFGKQSPEALDAMSRWKVATQQASDVQDDLNANLKSTTDSLIAQRDELFNNIDSEIRYKDELSRVSEGLKDHGKSIDLNTDAGRRNVEGLRTLTDTAIQNLDQMKKNGATTEQITTKEDYYKNSLYNTAIQIGYTKEEARKYVDQLNLVPDNVSTNVSSNIVEQTKLLQDYINKIGYIKNLGVTQITFDAVNQINTIVRGAPRASGGIDLVGMATGGILPFDMIDIAKMHNVANIVRPNTPTLIGDNKRFNESYIPLDPSSPRSQDIFDITAKALGRTILPVADKAQQLNSKASQFNAPPSTTTQKNFDNVLALSKFDTNSNGNNSSSSSNDNQGPSDHSNITNISSTKKFISESTSEPTIGTVVMQIPYGASPKEYVEHLDFELQYRRKKGVYKR